MVSFTVYKYTSSLFTSFQSGGCGGKAASDLGAHLADVRPKEPTVRAFFLSQCECLTVYIKDPAWRGGLNGANILSWCSGSTMDFDSIGRGSNPCGSANMSVIATEG